jgi:hypothetical protein
MDKKSWREFKKLLTSYNKAVREYIEEPTDGKHNNAFELFEKIVTDYSSEYKKWKEDVVG